MDPIQQPCHDPLSMWPVSSCTDDNRPRNSFPVYRWTAAPSRTYWPLNALWSYRLNLDILTYVISLPQDISQAQGKIHATLVIARPFHSHYEWTIMINSLIILWHGHALFSPIIPRGPEMSLMLSRRGKFHLDRSHPTSSFVAYLKTIFIATLLRNSGW